MRTSTPPHGQGGILTCYDPNYAKAKWLSIAIIDTSSLAQAICAIAGEGVERRNTSIDDMRQKGYNAP